MASLPHLLVIAGLLATALLVSPAGGQDGRTEGQIFRNTVLESRSISDSDIQDATVRDSDLYGVHIRGATIERTRVENAAISNATIRASTVLRTSFHRVTIEDSDVTGSTLDQARMVGGKLTASSVRATTLEGVTVCNVHFISESRIDNTGCGIVTPPAPTPTTPTTPGTQPPPTADRSVFSNDDRTLARFEFNGNTRDASGNGRDLTPRGSPEAYVASRSGQSLAITNQGPGLDWTPYASRMTHPFTVELVVTPTTTTGYRKLFSFDDNQDAGWYILDGTLRAYPASDTRGSITPGATHYIAFVSTSAQRMDVYVDGAPAGSLPMSFTAPPPQAIFLRDDRSGGEQFEGTIEALRISTGTRSASEIGGVQARLG